MTPSNHLILCCALLLLPSVFPRSRVFFNESSLHMWWPKYWSFSFSTSPSNERSVLISFRIDWFDLVVQGTLKNLLQHHSMKGSILWSSGFFMVQLSHLYMSTGKTIALTIQIFTGKGMSLLFNMLSRFVRFSSKEQVPFYFMASVPICSDLGAQVKKSATVSVFRHIFTTKSWDQMT